MPVTQSSAPGITDYASIYSRPQLGAPSLYDEEEAPLRGGPVQQLPGARTVGGSSLDQMTSLLPQLAKGGKPLTGLAGKLASKGGILGKLGKGASANPTPWAIGGLGASALGDLISKKHAKTGGFVGGAGKGAATGAMIGSVIPGIGTAIGGVVGGLVGGLKGLFGGKKKLDEKKKAEAAAKVAASQQGLTSLMGGTQQLGVAPNWQGSFDEAVKRAYGLWEKGSQMPMWQPAGGVSSFLGQPGSYWAPTQQAQLNTPNLSQQPPYNVGGNMSNSGSYGG